MTINPGPGQSSPVMHSAESLPEASENSAYDAFISYSHGGALSLASALQAGLHSFAKPWYGRRLVRVFRDQTNLTLAPELWPEIEKALDTSRYLIFVASPTASESKWIRRELDHWLSTKESATLLIVIYEGTAVWDDNTGDFDWSKTNALPGILARKFRSEPLYLDFRGLPQDSLTLGNERFLDHVATLSACLRGVSKDEVFGAHIRERRRAMRIAWWTGLVLILLTTAASALGVRSYHQAREIESQNVRITAANESLRSALQNETAARERAEKQTRISQAQSWAAEAELALQRNKPQLALLLSAASLRVTEKQGEPRVPQAERVARTVLADVGGTYLGHIPPERASVTAISPDAKWLAAAGDGDALWLWNLRAMNPALSSVRLETTGLTSTLFFAGDGRWLIGCSETQQEQQQDEPGISIRLWDMSHDTATLTPIVLGDGGESALHWKLGTAGCALASKDGSWLITRSTGDDLVAWNLRQSNPVAGQKRLHGPAGGPTDVRFIGDSDRILVVGRDGTIGIDDLTDADPDRHTTVLRDPDGKAWLAVSTPDGRKVVTAGSGPVRLWTRRQSDGEWTSTELTKVERDITWADISPDGRWFLSGNSNGYAYASLVDLNAANVAESYYILTSNGGPVGIHVFDPTGQFLMTAAGYQSEAAASGTFPEPLARIWRLSLNDPTFFPLELPQSDVIMKGAASADGLEFATGAMDGTVRLWTVREDLLGIDHVDLRGHENAVSNVLFSSDGHWLITTSHDGSVRLWDLRRKQFGTDPTLLLPELNKIMISHDERWLLAVSASNAVVIDLNTQEVVMSLGPFYPSVEQFKRNPISAGFSANSRWLYIPYDGDMFINQEDQGTVILWPFGESVRPSEVKMIRARRQKIAWTATDPESRWLAVASRNKSTDVASVLEIFSLEAGSEGRLAHTMDDIVYADWSRTGDLLAVAQRGGGVRVWSLTDHEAQGIPQLLDNTGQDSRVSFSPDGKWLATGTWGGWERGHSVHLWRIVSNDIFHGPVTILDSGSNISQIEWSPDGSYLLTIMANGNVGLWDPKQGDASKELINLPIRLNGQFANVMFSNDGRWLFTANYKEAPYLWDLRNETSRAAPHRLAGHIFPEVRAVFSGNGRWLITTDYDIADTDAPGRTCRVWDLTADRVEESSVVLPGLPVGANAIGTLHDSRWLITASDDGVRRMSFGITALLDTLQASIRRSFSEEELRQFGIPAPLAR